MKISISLFLFASLLVGCSAKESHRAVVPSELPRAVASRNVPSAKLLVGQFANRSTFMNGIFADSTDKIGQQAHQILVTHLSQVPSFTVVDRRNMASLAEEAKYAGKKQRITGADAVLTGAVTEFGRKETGNRILGGIINKTKTQTLYAKVSLSIVDVSTSEILKSYQGAGEYSLTNKEVLGFGGYAGYDSTLADKVLNLAIQEAIQRLVEGRSANEW